MVYPALPEIAAGRRPAARRGAAVRVPATVVLLGLTSMFTDISSEMVTSILPLYLTFELSFTALQFGLYDGLSQGVQALVRIGGGAAADRRSGHKGLAMIGYGTSTVTRLAIMFTGGAWAPTTGVLLADRAAKGIRTAPRDAMISLASPPEMLGRSFGVHRMLDAFGALLGPLVAFAMLAALPGSYSAVFVVSFSVGLVGFAVLALFVPRQTGASRAERFRVAVARDVVRNAVLRRIVVAAALLGTLTISDAFLFLGYRRSVDMRLEFFPLLFTGTALVYLLLAVPVGRVADRIGRRTVFLGGYVVMGVLYVALLRPPDGIIGLAVVVGGLGLFYAATDGVLMALASGHLPTSTRATGLAVVATGTAAGRFVASVVFGATWSAFGPSTAFTAFAIALPIALVIAWRIIGPDRPTPRSAVDPDPDLESAP